MVSTSVDVLSLARHPLLFQRGTLGTSCTVGSWCGYLISVGYSALKSYLSVSGNRIGFNPDGNGTIEYPDELAAGMLPHGIIAPGWNGTS